MARRVNSELLLVGSLPADSTETALREAAGFFGDLVFALPDGETGPRAAWVGYERERLVRPNEGVATVEETESPTGIPRHAYETPVFAVKPGVTELRWESWPRIDDAIESYAVFRELRDAGVIPAGLRFQVGLPFPSSALNGFKADFARDYPVAERAFEDLAARELRRLTAAIPPGDLAIQWDMAYETQDIERVLAWTPEGAWERFAGPVTRLSRLLPEEVLLGYHLCYGTFPEWPMYEARDMEVLVRMANFAVANSGRPVDWLHLAGPRYLRSEDRTFFRPLVDLEPGDARVYLGIVLPIDGTAGLRRRVATASRYIGDFGVAMYCGFGRQPGADGTETMREHARVVRARRTRGQGRLSSDREDRVAAAHGRDRLVVEPHPALGQVAEPQRAARRHRHRGAAGLVGAHPQRVRGRIPVVEVADHGNRARRLIRRQRKGDLDHASAARLRRLDHVFP